MANDPLLNRKHKLPLHRQRVAHPFICRCYAWSSSKVWLVRQPTLGVDRAPGFGRKMGYRIFLVLHVLRNRPRQLAWN